MSDYYTASGDPVQGVGATTPQFRAEYTAIQNNISAKLAPYTGNANKIVTINAGATAQTVSAATLSAAGAMAGATYNGLTVTTTTATLTLTNGKTVTVSNTLTFTGTDGSSVAFGTGGTVLYSGGALGTPSSGTLTNCTFPTLNQNTSGTAAGLSATLVPASGGTGVANNNASTWTISGNYATTVTVTGVTGITLPTTGTLSTLAGTETLTNKRITARVGTTASSATPTINTDSYDEYHITALAAAITSFTTNLSGTPVTGDILIVEITDNGTARAITWGASFESSTITLPTTTVISALLTVTLKWNAATSKWRCVGVA